VDNEQNIVILNQKFKDYLANPGEPARSDLYDTCQRVAAPLRNKFPQPYHVLGDRFDDRLEDVFLKVTDITHAQSIDPDRFGQYFLRSAKNALIDQTRWQRQRRNKADSLDQIGDVEGENSVPHSSAELRGRIVEKIGGIPPKAVEMYCDYLEAISDGKTGKRNDGIYEGIAHRHRVAKGTVKSSLHRVRNRLEPLWAEMELWQYGGRDLQGLHEIIPELRRAIADHKRGKESSGVSENGHADEELDRREQQETLRRDGRWS
jgi:DNA-directed RNA polymerase specialized sigma24 family protein